MRPHPVHAPLVGTRRFLLELWLEPRELTSALRRLRGRVSELPPAGTAGSAGPARGVAGIEDLDDFLHEAFADDDQPSPRWEAEP